MSKKPYVLRRGLKRLQISSLISICISVNLFCKNICSWFIKLWLWFYCLQNINSPATLPLPRAIINSIRDARTLQLGEIIFNNMRYRSSETVQSSGYCQSSVSYVKVQIMFKGLLHPQNKRSLEHVLLYGKSFPKTEF